MKFSSMLNVCEPSTLQLLNLSPRSWFAYRPLYSPLCNGRNSPAEESSLPNVCSRGNQITLNFPFWIIHYASKDLKPSAGTSDDERKACRKACQPLEKQAFATDSAIPKDDSSSLLAEIPSLWTYLPKRESSANLSLQDTTPPYQGTSCFVFSVSWAVTHLSLAYGGPNISIAQGWKQ